MLTLSLSVLDEYKDFPSSWKLAEQFSPRPYEIKRHPLFSREMLEVCLAVPACSHLSHLYLVLHLLWKMFPARATGEVFGQFWGWRREVASRHTEIFLWLKYFP